MLTRNSQEGDEPWAYRMGTGAWRDDKDAQFGDETKANERPSGEIASEKMVIG